MREELDQLQEQLSLYQQKEKETMVHDEKNQDKAPSFEKEEEKAMQLLVEQWITDTARIATPSSLTADKVILEVTCEDGQVLNEIPISAQNWNREIMLHQFYEETLKDLRRKCEDSIAKVSYCEQYRLAAKEDRKRLQEKLDYLSQENHHLTEAEAQCQETLETTAKNYGLQIQLMSDHICELNEQIKDLTEKLAKYQSFINNSSVTSRVHR
jgi:exonuclease III